MSHHGCQFVIELLQKWLSKQVRCLTAKVGSPETTLVVLHLVPIGRIGCYASVTSITVLWLVMIPVQFALEVLHVDAGPLHQVHNQRCSSIAEQLLQYAVSDCLECVCTQAHFAKFTGRDAAMSKSLNSDYLSQLYIRADTKSMDKDLVRSEVATSGLPEEAQALVVFKRG